MVVSLYTVPADPLHTARRKPGHFAMLCGAVSVLFAGLLAYSQTKAFAWDEGFHLLAAQLISSGKLPYLDFHFPQTPLNAFWNAAWMHIFGDSWRVAHAFAALLTAGAALLTADFLLERFPVPRWRLATALAAAAAVGLNVAVVEFGTVGQAYALCLFLITAAFRLSTMAVEREGLAMPALAGVFAAAAANSSLLTAPVAPVLILWILIYNRSGRRLAKFAAFAGGGVVPCLPLLWLFTKAPRLVAFNVISYHLLYRREEWEGATRHDLEVMASWIDSPQALLLGLLAVAGLLFTVYKSGWDPRRRAELYLCAWLAAAQGAYLCTAHPTFSRYFLFTVPFVAILASVGLYVVASRLADPDRPFLPVAALTVLLALGLAKRVYDEGDTFAWRDLEEVARAVEQVTPPGRPLLADEHIYLLTRRPPPSGMEHSDSHKLNFAPGVAVSLHVVPEAELSRRIGAGTFATVETCEDEDELAGLKWPRQYARRAQVGDCTVFWDWRPAGAASTPGPGLGSGPPVH
jgi:hypothetical protein